jgi:hypothetical protein
VDLDDDPTLSQHELKIAMAQRLEAVRDHDGRPAGSQSLHDVNQVGFRSGVEGAGGLIKDDDGGIPEELRGPGQSVVVAHRKAGSHDRPRGHRISPAWRG